MHTLLLYPNPYAALDHNGLLAGRCVVCEEVRPGHIEPVNAFVGATLEFIGSETRDPHAEGTLGMPVGLKHRYECKFSSDPTRVNASAGALASYWTCRLAGEPEVFKAEADGGPPLEKLAAARLDAIAKFVSMYGKPPPIEKWAKQFALDELVAQVAEVVQVQRDAEWEQHKTAAKKTAEEAAATALKLEADRKQLWGAALNRALSKLKPAASKSATKPTKES